MAKQEILKEAASRGFDDGNNGYPGPDMADIADLITEATSDEMAPEEYNQAAAAVADAYAEDYQRGKNWKRAQSPL